MSGKHRCVNCIHRDACQDWTMFPLEVAIGESSCQFYEDVTRRVDIEQETTNQICGCYHAHDVIVRPDGVHELAPHAYKLTQLLRNVTVEVLTCETCGDVSVAWYRQDNTEDVTDGE